MDTTGHRVALFLAICAVASLLETCSGRPDSGPYTDDTPKELATTPAIGSVKGPTAGLLRVDPAPGTHWKQLVDVRLFEGLHPEISIEDTRERWGEPNREEQRPLGPCWIYQRELGTVEVCLEEWGSPPFPYTDKWVLHGVPLQKDPKLLLDAVVVEQLPDNLEELDISIMTDKGDRPAVSVEIRNGDVKRMTWFS